MRSAGSGSAALVAFAQHLARMEEWMQTTSELAQAGRRSMSEVSVGRFHLAEAKALAAQSAKK